jgi:hypothetical protein
LALISSVLFSFKTLGPVVYPKKRPHSARKLIQKGDKKNFKAPFKPAALKKNEVFWDNVNQFGENAKTIDSLIEANTQVLII